MVKDGQGWSRIVKSVQGLSLSRIFKDGQGWSRIVKGGQRCSREVELQSFLKYDFM